MSVSSLARTRSHLLESGRKVLWEVAPRLFDTFVSPYGMQKFAIGVYSGATLSTLRDTAGIQNPVLTCADITDVPAAFVADPFMLRHGELWFMLFEVMSRITRRGQIGMASSIDGQSWRYHGTVLRERFHLAYPYVFEHEGEVYLVPDSPGQGIRLYRALDFPRKWEFVNVLRTDNIYSDASIFQFRERWWMFAAWSPDIHTAKSLRLFHSDHPLGDWIEHPASPVVKENDRIARPGGRVLVAGDRIVRLAQDCETVYGRCVSAFEVVELTQTRYAERPAGKGPVLNGGRAAWNAGGMHHIDVHRAENGGLIACVDGWHQVAAGNQKAGPR